MPGGIYREIKTVTSRIPSGATTASAIYLGGYAVHGLSVPVLTSAVVSFATPFTGGAVIPVADGAGNVKTVNTPGGTGGVAVGADSLAYLAAFHPILISAAAAQASARDFIWHLKG